MGRKGSIYPEYEKDGEDDEPIAFDNLDFDEELDFSDDYEDYDEYTEEDGDDDEYCNAG